MKKKIFIVAFIFTVFVHAMEKENKWSITAYGTKINLHQADILEYYADDRKKEDVVVCVGKYKQEELGAIPCKSNSVGDCYVQRTVRFTPKKGSLNYQRAYSEGWQLHPREGICFLCVTEPHLCTFSFFRSVESLGFDKNFHIGKLTIRKSCDDLLFCYNAALDHATILLKEKKSKNIALPMLGADSEYDLWGIPEDKAVPIAVDAILTYIKNKPNFYDTIQLFMEEDADFNLYKKLLIQWINTEKNVLLFYFAHKDSEHLLSSLPCELISYIANLI